MGLHGGNFKDCINLMLILWKSMHWKNANLILLNLTVTSFKHARGQFERDSFGSTVSNQVPQKTEYNKVYFKMKTIHLTTKLFVNVFSLYCLLIDKKNI